MPRRDKNGGWAFEWCAFGRLEGHGLPSPHYPKAQPQNVDCDLVDQSNGKPDARKEQKFSPEQIDVVQARSHRSHFCPQQTD
jgi:hypothetical protein